MGRSGRRRQRRVFGIGISRIKGHWLEKRILKEENQLTYSDSINS